MIDEREQPKNTRNKSLSSICIMMLVVLQRLRGGREEVGGGGQFKRISSVIIYVYELINPNIKMTNIANFHLPGKEKRGGQEGTGGCGRSQVGQGGRGVGGEGGRGGAWDGVRANIFFFKVQRERSPASPRPARPPQISPRFRKIWPRFAQILNNV